MSDLSQLSNSELVASFIDLTSRFSQPEVAKNFEGITQSDVSRWRRGDWKRLTAVKRRALEAGVARFDDEASCSAAMMRFGLSEGDLAELLGAEPGMVQAWISEPGAITPVAHMNLLNLLTLGLDAHRKTLEFGKATQRRGQGAPVSRAQIVIDLIEDSVERGHARWFLVYILEPSIGPESTEADKSMWYGYKTGIGYEPPTDETLANFYKQMADSTTTTPTEHSDAEVANIVEGGGDEDGETEEVGR